MTELQKSYGTLSDAQLANFVSLGDDRAFDELVVRYLDTISIIARKFSAEGYEHNDFVQEGLVGLLCSCKAFDQNGGASFKSYMSVVVERRFISIIRRGEQKKAIPSSSIVSMDDVGESIEDSAKTPEELLMCREQLDQLLLRLQSVLSKSEYDVFMLYGNGLSYKEIAEKLSVTEKAVDNALQRARKKVHGGLNVG